MMQLPWRAIRHYLFIACAAVSLLLCAGVATFWAYESFNPKYVTVYQTTRRVGSTTRPQDYWIFLNPAGIDLGTLHRQTPVKVGPEIVPYAPWDIPASYVPYLSNKQSVWHGFALREESVTHTDSASIIWFHGRMHSLVIPYWSVVALLAILPLYRAYRRVRFGERWRLARPGFCAKCGYDLRASKDRCPECGTAIPAPPQAETS